MIREDIIFEDTTLRDGEQTPGIAFDKKTKFAIHDLLVDAGVRWIEPGIPAMGGQELEFLKELVARGSDATLVAWNRGVMEDVKLSIDLGFRAVHIGLPTSKIHLKNSVRKDSEWLLNTARDIISYAKDRDVFVSVSAEDVGRTDEQFLIDYANHVHEAGADRVRLSDTIGILTPEQYGKKVRIVRENTNAEAQCHTHNDFGLALPNLLAGLQNGAKYFHATVNGIGERAGMADLIQVHATLKYLYDIDLGFDSKKLVEVSKLVAEKSRQPFTKWQPIVGGNVYAHESGIHVNGMLRDTSTFEPFPPEDFGFERSYVIGKHSGTSLLKHVLEKNGISTESVKLEECLQLTRAASVKSGTDISEAELMDLYSTLS